MASAFSIEFSISESPAEAQARAVHALAEPAKAVGLRLTQFRAGELDYRPLVQWPFLIVLWHNLNGERMTVEFEPADGAGTNVRINGAVARGKHSLATDPEHWADALGGESRAAPPVWAE